MPDCLLSGGVQKLLGDVRAQQGQVERLHEQCKLLTTSSEIRDGRARCQDAVEKVTRTVKQVRDQLNDLELVNTEIVALAQVGRAAAGEVLGKEGRLWLCCTGAGCLSSALGTRGRGGVQIMDKHARLRD